MGGGQSHTPRINKTPCWLKESICNKSTMNKDEGAYKLSIQQETHVTPSKVSPTTTRNSTIYQTTVKTPYQPTERSIS